VGVDERPETLGKRIREAEIEKVPYVIVWGERESRDALAVRRRGGEQSTVGLGALVDELSQAATI
jgi:threonyl-tRNA synthetase